LTLALRDKSEIGTAAACQFLQAVQQIGSLEAKPAVFLQKFPPLPIPQPFVPAKWKPPEAIDFGSDPPPFYPTDPTLNFLPYAQAIKDALLPVKVEPFTEWSEKVFQSEAVRSGGGEGEVVERVPSKKDALAFGDLLRKIQKALARKTMGHDSMSVSRTFSDLRPLELPSVNIDVFTPSTAQINEAGSEIEDGDFPAVFA
jgi:hypothetical protein